MKHDHMKLILIKGALPLAFSVAGILLSLLMARRRRRDEEYRCPVALEEEDAEGNHHCPAQSSDCSESIPSCSERICERMEMEMEDFGNGYCQRKEITGLPNHLNVLRDREKELEERVLRYIGMKERESALREGQNALELEIAQIDSLGLKVEFMEAECRWLTEYLNVVSQLKASKSEVEMLKRKMRKLWRDNRKGLRALHQQAGFLRLLEAKSAEEKQGLEDTIIGLLQKVRHLESEKRELMETLELREIPTPSTSQSQSRVDGDRGDREDPCEAVGEEKLLNQIEQLQNDRLANLEELIHLRWVNACLRYELWRTQEQQKSSEEEATRRTQIRQLEEQETKGDYDTTGYDSEVSSPGTEKGGATAVEVAGGRHPGTTKPILFQRLKKWVKKKEGCKRAAAVSDVEDDCNCPGRLSFDDAAMGDPARNSC